MQAQTRTFALVGVAVAVGALVYGVVHRIPNNSRDELAIVVLDKDTSRILMPDTVARGVPFAVTFRTFGGGCLRSTGRTTVALTAATAILRPYDHNERGGSCAADTLLLQHTQTLRFDVDGVASVRLAGRQWGAGAARGLADVTRSVVVRAVYSPAPPKVLPARSPSGFARGVVFSIDSLRERIVPGSDSSAAALFSRFTGVVRVAAGRGRLDVNTMNHRPVVSVSGIMIADPLADAGDYYLFDSLGAILVRPKQRTFSSFSFAVNAFSFWENREGWPGMLKMSAIRPEVLHAPVDAERLQHGEIRFYWHLDRDQQTPSMHTVSYGRLVVRDAPIGELGVLRWFGPARALAAMEDLSEHLPAGSLGVGGLAPLSPLGGARGQVNVFMQPRLYGLRAAYIDLNRLALPPGFRKTRWPGFEGVAVPSKLWRDSDGRWRVKPAG